MDKIVEQLVLSLFAGGPGAIIAILVIAVAALIYDRKRLLAEVTKKDEKLDRIIDDYYRGNMTLSEALNSLKLVLHEIKGKIR